MSVAPVQPKDEVALNADGTLSGRARAVPFAREAQHFAALAAGPVRARRSRWSPPGDCRRDEERQSRRRAAR
jgi:hypothetical protein